MKIKNIVLNDGEYGNIIIGDKEIKLHNTEDKLDINGNIEVIRNFDDVSRLRQDEILNIADEWLEYFKKSMNLLRKKFRDYSRKNHRFLISVSKSDIRGIPVYHINNVIQEYSNCMNCYNVSGASIDLPEDYKDVFMYLVVSSLKYALEESHKVYTEEDSEDLKTKGLIFLDSDCDYVFKLYETELYNLNSVPELKEYVSMTLAKHRLNSGDIVDTLRNKVISHNYSSIIANSMDYNRTQIEYLESVIKDEDIKAKII